MGWGSGLLPQHVDRPILGDLGTKGDIKIETAIIYGSYSYSALRLSLLSFDLCTLLIYANFQCGHRLHLENLTSRLVTINQMQVAHTCNPSYSRGRDQEECSSKPAQVNGSVRPYLEKTYFTKKDW
jgi:hypothetical protein